MKVSLKTTVEKLAVINSIAQGVYNCTPTLDIMENVTRSIAFDVADKLSAKWKSVVKKSNNLFQYRAKLSIALKYHEAWALRDILRDLIVNCETDFQRQTVQKTINDLDKSLN
jgi:hypothetical protein